MLRDIQRDTGMAIIPVTHDWGVVAQTGDRAAVMYAGQVVEQASVVDMLAAPCHPSTAALLASDPHRAVRGERLRTHRGDGAGACRVATGLPLAASCELRIDSCDDVPPPMVRLDDGRSSRCLRVLDLTGLDGSDGPDSMDSTGPGKVSSDA